MKILSETDYVLYDKRQNQIAKFAIGKQYVIYGNKKEAEEDCVDNQEVIKCTDLPKHLQFRLLQQINANV